MSQRNENSVGVFFAIFCNFLDILISYEMSRIKLRKTKAFFAKPIYTSIFSIRMNFRMNRVLLFQEKELVRELNFNDNNPIILLSYELFMSVCNKNLIARLPKCILVIFLSSCYIKQIYLYHN